MRLTCNFKSIAIAVCILIIVLYILPANVTAMKNPSAVYCTELGYQFEINKTTAGEIGMCRLSDTVTVPAWKFLQGQQGQNFSYCRQKGYDQKFVKDVKVCQNAMVDSCMVCILPDHREIEATQLMNISYEENKCGDGICSYPNNYQNCPQDCPSGGRDGYCDKVKDSICDRDCTRGEDPDCPLLVFKNTETGTSVRITPLPQSSPTPKATPGFAMVTGIIGLATGIFIITKQAKR